MAVKQSFSSNKNKSEIVLYQTPDGKTKFNVRFEGETAWLTQDQMSELFQTDRTSIAKHIKNIFDTEELDQTITCAKFAQLLQDGRTDQYSTIIWMLLSP